MNRRSLGRVEGFLRLSVPYALLALFFIAGFIWLPIPHADMIRPQFVLMTVYYWAIYRPTLVPPFLCFFIGLLIDMLTGTLPGMNAFLLVAVQWHISGQRRFLMGQSYATIWAVFSLVALITLLLQFLLQGFSGTHVFPVMPMAVSLLVTILFFPLITRVLFIVHRILPVASGPVT